MCLDVFTFWYSTPSWCLGNDIHHSVIIFLGSSLKMSLSWRFIFLLLYHEVQSYNNSHHVLKNHTLLYVTFFVSIYLGSGSSSSARASFTRWTRSSVFAHAIWNWISLRRNCYPRTWSRSSSTGEVDVFSGSLLLCRVALERGVLGAWVCVSSRLHVNQESKSGTERCLIS